MPWLLALLPTLVLSAWHRAYFIGLHLFDDAWYQAAADDHAYGGHGLVTRTALILLYQAASAIAPSRSWAVLGLGACKTYLLLAATTALLRREIGLPLAFAVACVAALCGAWQYEFTLVLPDSWMTVLCLCSLAYLYGAARPRPGAAGAFVTLAFYVKELSAAVVLVPVAIRRWQMLATRRFVIGAAVAFVALWAIVSGLQRQPWNPFGLTSLLVVSESVHDDLATKVRRLPWFVTDDTPLGLALTLSSVLGLAAATLLRRWSTEGGRALAAWTVILWLTYLGAAAGSGYYTQRYTIGPRIVLLISGIAGWLVLLRSASLTPTRVRSLQAALVIVLLGASAHHGVRAHRSVYDSHLVWQDLERRVADLIDRLPASTPVTLYVDPRDPEDAMGREWWPRRVFIRLLTLSETSPPRALTPIKDVPPAPPLGRVYITNVAPAATSAESVTVTFESPPTEARRLSMMKPLRPDAAKRYRGIRRLYVVAPRDVASAVRAEELTTPASTLWR